ncbi:MAG: sugar-binding transcriptional regulator [Eubacteriales bacterium]
MSEKSNMRDLMIATAKLYYIDGFSQEEISKQLFVSRPTVSRLLKSSLKEGIVEIRIDDASSYCFELAKQIENKFSINKVIVTPSSYNQGESKQNVGAAAAIYLESILKDNSVLGIAWGTTLRYVVKNIRPNPKIKSDVIQLIGGIGNKTKDTDANALTLRLARVLNGDGYILHAPFIVKNKVLKDLLMDETYIKQHFEKIQDVNVALVGLGSVNPDLSGQFRSGHINLEDMEKIKREGAIGDICGGYIDINGNKCHTSLTNRIISISLTDLCAIQTVIGVACGNNKKDIITGALRGKYLDVLIIDKNAALAILEDLH